MITIYCEHISPRLSYTCKVIFEDILGQPHRLTDDESVFLTSNEGLNYSNKDIKDKPFIRPHGLLFEQGIRTQDLQRDRDGHIFQAKSNLVEHDLLASCFYLISRYEEYVDNRRDAFGRFESRQSFMGRANLLHRPLVDIWAHELYSALAMRFPFIPRLTRTYSQLSTIDVDVAYAYKSRNWWRRTRSSLHDLKNLDFKRIKQRQRVLKGTEPDPFDSFDELRHLHQEAGVPAHFFFLIGKYGPLDKNLSPKRNDIQKLVLEVGEWAEVGLHPSMASNSSVKALKMEFARLAKTTGKKVDTSRQHFLYLDLPYTYRRLIKLGIEVDFTMGFADHVGFRAGTSHPFPWYDLKEEKMTSMFLMPLSLMDASLQDYMGLSPEEALVEVQRIKEEVKAINGTFVSLWHNDSVTDHGKWQGWKKVFLECLAPID